MTLYEVMKKTALEKPDNDSVVFYGKRYSFSKMLRFIDAAAAGLKKAGLKKGDTVTLCMPNTPSAQVAFYALNKIGVIVNLVHPKIPPVGLIESIKKTNSVMLIAYDLYLADFKVDYNGLILMSKSNYFMGFAAKAFFRFANRKKKFPRFEVFETLFCNAPDAQTEQFGENEPAVYLASGGTTGTSKIVMHSNKAFILLCNHVQFFLSEDVGNYKAMYTVLPIFHGFGLCMNMLMCVQQGFKNVMSIKFSPKSLARAVEKEGVNIIMGVPSMFNKLIKSKHFNKADLTALKNCFVGGDSVSASMLSQFNAILARQNSRAVLYEGYGLTETVTVNAVNNIKNNREGSAGKALPGCEIKIFSKDFKAVERGEVGEICVNTPIMMLGYLESDSSPIKNIDGRDWLFTGDLGYMDEDGFLFFKQRAKSLIKVSGVPVFPSEVEAVAQSIEGVIRAAAIGVPDASAGEAVKLFAEVPALKEINQDELKQKILDACAQNLIFYAVPKYIELKETLPLNDMGKVDVNKLKT